ncbi:MAG: ribosome small subunit-dependent GTPase A [Ilumatobacteraceae bacterium]|nr:ribosome small subunit-dependent GTPase A [Ilumatobacteraceae bacterium]
MQSNSSPDARGSVLPAVGRVTRLDRGWSTVLFEDSTVMRVRNFGVDIAVGDRVHVTADGEKIAEVLLRTSALVRRASFEGALAERHVVAANIDTVFLVHAASSPPNQRRLERELILAFDSGATPVIVLTKNDIADPDHVTSLVDALTQVAAGVAIHVVSGITGNNVDVLREYATDGRTIALMGASGVGKSTLINALVGHAVQRTAEVREGDQRGRHTTVAAELVALPTGGWLLDTPGLRAVTLWTSGQGIERAFPDIFSLVDNCRFRDCKHQDEPGCAVQQAIINGTLPEIRLQSMRRLVAEEEAVEREQEEKEKSYDKRGMRRPATDKNS